MNHSPALCGTSNAASNNTISNPVQRPFYLMKRSTRQDIRCYITKWIPFHKFPIKISGDPIRSRFLKPFQNISKTGHLDFMIGGLSDPCLTPLIYKDISKIRNLKHFHLHLEEYSDFSKTPCNEGVISIAKAIRAMKDLRSLKIVFCESGDLCNDSVKALIKEISKCHILEELDLTFFKCDNLNDEAFSNMRVLKSLEKLKSFTICLDWNDKFTDRAIQNVEDMLSYRSMKQLQTFHFRFQKNYSQEISSLVSLANACEHLAHLERLNNVCLSFNRWDKGNFDELAPSLGKLKDIKSLKLSFQYCSFNNLKLENVCNALKTLTGLRHLNLDFEWHLINDLTSLGSLIDHLTGLMSLSLKLRAISATDNYYTLDLLINSIINLKDLKSLKINLQSWDNIDEESARLLEVIRQNPCLEEIDFQFQLSPDQYLTDPSLEVFDENTFKLTNLKNLSLGFTKSQDLEKDSSSEEDGFLLLRRYLAPISGLLKLTLSFAHCTELGNLAVSDLSEGLKNLNSLISLNLDFRYCTKISDEGLKNLSGALLSLNRLEELQLNLYWAKINDEGLIELCNAVKKLRFLILFKLTLTCRGHFSDVGIDALYQTVAQLKSLSVFDFAFFGHQSQGKEILRQILGKFIKNVQANTKIDEVYFNKDDHLY